MGAILSIAGKELRALFQSQIAIVFLGLFELSTLFTFFALSRFFARNIADMNPFFEALPLQLILLVSATSMRAWAEERKSGTLEVLLTLPVRTWDLVLGKFVAGMALVSLALAFTLPLPITVWMLGPLDWGPVIGGYVGALLLSAAYLAIGLCVSARTDNQVLALLATLGIGGLLYLVGTEDVQALLGVTGGEIASRLGTGARFESIARGVLDLRDMAYYAAIAAFFLVLNVFFLDRSRIDPSGDGRGRLNALRGLVVLAGLNAVLLVVWTEPVRSARIDLTQNRDYSISPVTRQILAELPEPLTIQGIFSERNHPKLQPRVPQLVALLEEYAVVGGDRVTVEIVDPGEDDDLAEVLEQEYGVRSVPMPVTDRNEARVVNAWFHVLVKYGDQHTVIDFDDLVEVEANGDDVQVRLRDPEYDITKAIRKVSQDFVSTASLVGQLPAGSELVLYATPQTLPNSQQTNLDTMRAVAEELAGLSDRLTYTEVDPSQDAAAAERAAEFGIRPSLSLQTGDVYYLHLLFRSGDLGQRIFPRGELSKSDLQKTLDAVFKRAVPGQLRTVGFVTEIPAPPQPDPRLPPHMQPPPPQADYQVLQQALGSRFEVQPNVDLSKGSVPDVVDVLVIGKSGPLSPKAQLALEQFLLRGGSIIALAGRSRVRFQPPQGFVGSPEDPALFTMLERWGARVENEHVLDERMGSLVLPVGRQHVQFDYPYWPDVRRDGMEGGHLAVASLPNVTVPWGNRLSIDAVPEGVQADVLLRSSDRSWRRESDALMPDFQTYPELGYPEPPARGQEILAVTLTGRFPPFFDADSRPEAEGTLDTAIADGRLTVIGSSAIADDTILSYARSAFGRLHANNELLLENLVDWSLADTDLLSIRNPGQFSRTLDPVDADTLFRIELADYALVLLPLPLLYAWSRRRRPAPRVPEVSS